MRSQKEMINANVVEVCRSAFGPKAARVLLPSGRELALPDESFEYGWYCHSMLRRSSLGGKKRKEESLSLQARRRWGRTTRL